MSGIASALSDMWLDGLWTVLSMSVFLASLGLAVRFGFWLFYRLEDRIRRRRKGAVAMNGEGRPARRGSAPTARPTRSACRSGSASGWGVQRRQRLDGPARAGELRTGMRWRPAGLAAALKSSVPCGFRACFATAAVR